MFLLFLLRISSKIGKFLLLSCVFTCKIEDELSVKFTFRKLSGCFWRLFVNLFMRYSEEFFPNLVKLVFLKAFTPLYLSFNVVILLFIRFFILETWLS